MQAQHEVAMAEFADFYVEEEEKSFGDEEASRPVEAAGAEVDRPKVDDVWAKIASRRQSAPKMKKLRMTAGASMP